MEWDGMEGGWDGREMGWKGDGMENERGQGGEGGSKKENLEENDDN